MRKLLWMPALLILIGCKSQPDLVGQWLAKADMLGQQGQIEMVMNPDGTYKTTMTLTGQSGLGMTSIDTGTWKATGDKVSYHLSDVEWDFTGPADGVAKARRHFESNKATIIQEANAHPEVTIAWNGDDEFTATYHEGPPHTFRRVK